MRYFTYYFKSNFCQIRVFNKCIQSSKNFHSSFLHLQKKRVISSAEKLVQEKWEVKMKFWMRKYEELFGITKLSESHSKVLNVQEQIQSVQEKRRKVQEEIFVAQRKLQEAQEVLHKTSLGDIMYISHVTQVLDLLKEQRSLQESFSLYDRTEQELQTNLARAINSSQDYEREYREKNKYLSLITGVAGALIGLLGSSINNWRHKRDIKSFANDVLNFSSDILNQVSNLQAHINKLIALISPEEGTIPVENLSKAEELTKKFSEQQEVFENNIKCLDSLINNKVLFNVENKESFQMDIPTQQILYNLENKLDSTLKFHLSMNIAMFSSILLLGSFLFYISNSS